MSVLASSPESVRSGFHDGRWPAALSGKWVAFVERGGALWLTPCGKAFTTVARGSP